ncbi:hypothetical protein PS2_272 [Serratia phage PS2]|uniref:Uncharacterized protein n=1 Tax=Serratia phage PS2 TaxID=1481112 RepID=A0A023W5G4_9CAUD|nr:hypothetical protein FF83_gp143 [Serratia phage PS2]AHY25510.1 hypothetical protein PS2_272 [Serratia phage PS2]
MSLKDGLKAIHEGASLDTDGQVEQIYDCIEALKEEYPNDKAWVIVSSILLIPVLLVVGFCALTKEILAGVRYAVMVLAIIYGAVLGSVRDHILKLFKSRKA